MLRINLIVIVAVVVLVLVGALVWGLLGGGETKKIVVMDDMDRELKLAGRPERVISLAPNVTEILFALGLDDMVVGVTTECDYPAQAREKRQVGDINVDFEAVLEQEPDLIFMMGGMEEARERLGELGLTVAVVDPKDLDEVMESIMWVARITEAEDTGTELVEDMQARIELVRERAGEFEHEPTVFYEVWDEPLMAAGPGTFINALIREAGGKDIAQDMPQPWGVFSEEKLFLEDPEVILVSWHNYEQVLKREGWQGLQAIKNERVEWIDPDIIARPGPRIVDGLEAVQAAIFPEVH